MPLEQMLPINRFFYNIKTLLTTYSDSLQSHIFYDCIVSLFKEQVFAYHLVNFCLIKTLKRKENFLQIDHNSDVAIFSVKVKKKGRHTHS